MLAFAEREFQLNKEVEGSGGTLRDHCASIARQSGGEWPEEWLPRVCPPELVYVWNWFAGMNLRRLADIPFSNQEVLAWAERRGLRLTAFENETLDALELVYQRSKAND